MMTSAYTRPSILEGLKIKLALHNTHLLQNMDEIERRIRTLARSTCYNVVVFSGEHEVMRKFQLRDRNRKRKFPHKFIWKVVTIDDIGESLAIITLNLPVITQEDALNQMFCPDVCDSIDWMKNTEWRNVLLGFTFCCDALEFTNVVQPVYKNMFGEHILTGKNLN